MTSDNILTTERRLLSSLTHDATDVQRSVSAGLTADDFATGSPHSAIFRAICKVSVQGDSPDPSSVYRAMAGLGGASVPSIAALAEILFAEPTSLHRRQLTEDVISLSKRRRLRASVTALLEEIDVPDENWSATWERVAPHLQAAQMVDAGGKRRPKEEVIAEAAKILGPKDNVGLVGPFRAWDIDARKLRAGELCVLAARPGVGKSALALQYATACVGAGLTAAVFSLEMSQEENLARLATQHARSSKHQETIPLLAGIAALPYVFHEISDARTLPQIEARARLCAATCKLGVIIVDYLQLVSPPPEVKKEQRERQVAEMSRRFKMLAGELRVPIILLAQLNREMERDGNRRPRLSDLRESGAIEQDADAVWFLHQQEPQGVSDGDRETVEVHLIQAKRRNWQPGIFMKLAFQRAITTFNPMHP